MFLKEKLPEIYHEILSDLLEIKIPNEGFVNCSSCNLCQTDKSPYLNYKCCNYFPSMPNYLLGGVLLDDEMTSGQEKITNLIESKTNSHITNKGIFPSDDFLKQQQNSISQEKLFSSIDDLELQKCPYLADGNCSIWSQREHLCVTFFCSHASGKSGKKFWKKLDEMLTYTEQVLADYCSKNLSQNTDLVSYYKESYKLIKQLSKVEFSSIYGVKFQKDIIELKQLSLESLMNEIPQFLKLKSELIKLKNDSFTNLTETKVFDNVYLPFVKLFNGKKSTESIFNTAYKVLLNLESVVNDLMEEKILVEVNNY